MIDLAFGILLTAIGGVIGGALALSRRNNDRDAALVRYRVALASARAMIQDEDYVTARHCAESMLRLGEDE